MRAITLATMLLVAGLTAGAANAITFYGTGGFSGDLITIDSQTGASAVVANMGISEGIGAAYDGNRGIMYVRDFDNLYTVDLATAATTWVGASGSSITGLAFDPTFTTLYSTDQRNGDFYAIDPNTGAATLVGNTGVAAPLDLSTDPSTGILYGASLSGAIFSIDRSTGAATPLFADLAGGLALTGISFDDTGALFGVTLRNDEFRSIDLSVGSSSQIGPSVLDNDIRGLDFIRSPIPEPASALLLLGGLVGLAAAGGRGASV